MAIAGGGGQSLGGTERPGLLRPENKASWCQAAQLPACQQPSPRPTTPQLSWDARRSWPGGVAAGPRVSAAQSPQSLRHPFTERPGARRGVGGPAGAAQRPPVFSREEVSRELAPLLPPHCATRTGERAEGRGAHCCAGGPGAAARGAPLSLSSAARGSRGAAGKSPCWIPGRDRRRVCGTGREEAARGEAGFVLVPHTEGEGEPIWLGSTLIHGYRGAFIHLPRGCFPPGGPGETPVFQDLPHSQGASQPSSPQRNHVML